MGLWVRSIEIVANTPHDCHVKLSRVYDQPDGAAMPLTTKVDGVRMNTMPSIHRVFVLSRRWKPIGTDLPQ